MRHLRLVAQASQREGFLLAERSEGPARAKRQTQGAPAINYGRKDLGTALARLKADREPGRRLQVIDAFTVSVYGTLRF